MSGSHSEKISNELLRWGLCVAGVLGALYLGGPLFEGFLALSRNAFMGHALDQLAVVTVRYRLFEASLIAGFGVFVLYLQQVVRQADALTRVLDGATHDEASAPQPTSLANVCLPSQKILRATGILLALMSVAVPFLFLLPLIREHALLAAGLSLPSRGGVFLALLFVGCPTAWFYMRVAEIGHGFQTRLERSARAGARSLTLKKGYKNLVLFSAVLTATVYGIALTGPREAQGLFDARGFAGSSAIALSGSRTVSFVVDSFQGLPDTSGTVRFMVAYEVDVACPDSAIPQYEGDHQVTQLKGYGRRLAEWHDFWVMTASHMPADMVQAARNGTLDSATVAKAFQAVLVKRHPAAAACIRAQYAYART